MTPSIPLTDPLASHLTSKLTSAYALTAHADHFRALFLGPPGRESDKARAARLTAGHDVLTDLLDAGERDHVAREDALYALVLRAVAVARCAPIRRSQRQGPPGAALSERAGWLEQAA